MSGLGSMLVVILNRYREKALSLRLVKLVMQIVELEWKALDPDRYSRSC